MASYFNFIANGNFLADILAGKVKFSKVGELNDPSELVPYFNETQYLSSLNEMRMRGFTDEDMDELRRNEILMDRISPEEKVIGAPPSKEEANKIIRLPIYDNSSYMRKKLYSTSRTMSENIGVFCLTRRYESLPMWAHYSNNARGLVIEYGGLDELFVPDDTGILNGLHAVEYNRHREGVAFAPTSFRLLFLSKLPDWQYEDEVRAIQALANCQETVLSDGAHLHMMTIPKKCVRSVTMGWNMSADDREKIRATVKYASPPVTLYNARFDGSNSVVRETA